MKKHNKDFFEKVEAQVIKGAKGYVKEKVKSTVVKWGEFSVLVLLSLIMISMGVAYLIGFYYPMLNNGLNFVLLGMIFLFMSLLVRM